MRLPQPGPTPQAPPTPWTVGPADPFPQPEGAYGGDDALAAEAKHGPGVGARVLGIVVGLALGLLGFVGMLVGQLSPEGNQIKGLWFGVGLLLLAAAVVLGSWTAAAPITAGIVGAVPGLFGVIAPVTWRDTVGQLPDIDLGLDLAGLSANAAINELGTYSAAAAGVLLVVAGITTALGRRRGAARPA